MFCGSSLSFQFLWNYMTSSRMMMMFAPNSLVRQNEGAQRDGRTREVEERKAEQELRL